MKQTSVLQSILLIVHVLLYYFDKTKDSKEAFATSLPIVKFGSNRSIYTYIHIYIYVYIYIYIYIYIYVIFITLGNIRTKNHVNGDIKLN